MREIIRLDDHLTVELESQSVVSDQPARVKVLKDDVGMLNLEVDIDSHPGADMGLYPAVKFVITKVKPTK